MFPPQQVDVHTKSQSNHSQPADQPHPERGTGCDSGPTGIKKIGLAVKTFESPRRKEMMRGLIAVVCPSLCWNDTYHSGEKTVVQNLFQPHQQK